MGDVNDLTRGSKKYWRNVYKRTKTWRSDIEKNFPNAEHIKTKRRKKKSKSPSKKKDIPSPRKKSLEKRIKDIWFRI